MRFICECSKGPMDGTTVCEQLPEFGKTMEAETMEEALDTSQAFLIHHMTKGGQIGARFYVPSWGRVFKTTVHKDAGEKIPGYIYEVEDRIETEDELCIRAKYIGPSRP